jgi:hypothetical protein
MEMKITLQLLRQGSRANAFSEQNREAFLTEVVVMRQDVADASLAHRMHRDAIR